MGFPAPDDGVFTQALFVVSSLLGDVKVEVDPACFYAPEFICMHRIGLIKGCF